jgi:hypothetical protein
MQVEPYIDGTPDPGVRKMNHFCVAYVIFAFAGTIAAFSPLVANAQTASNADFTPGELRSQYIAHGYQVDAPIAWWTPDHVTTVRVSDPTSDRVVMLVVYPDVATAAAVRASVATHDGGTAGTAPRLIAGYGYSAWRGNVALVESTADGLARQYAAEQAADNQLMTGMPPAVDSPNPSQTYAIDQDLLDVVDSDTVSL